MGRGRSSLDEEVLDEPALSLQLLAEAAQLASFLSRVTSFARQQGTLVASLILMQTLQSILVPVDGSQASAIALEHAVALALRDDLQRRVSDDAV